MCISDSLRLGRFFVLIAKDGSDIPADKRKRNLKWVPPIAVNVDSADEMPSVIRKVD